MSRGVLHAWVERELTLGRGLGEPAPAHVSAASGVVAAGDHLYVVVDDEVALGVFPRRGGGPGRLVPLGFAALPADHGLRKRAKPDLEALCLLPPHAGAPHGALLALGSGSAAPRRRGVRWPLDAAGELHGAPDHLDLGGLYDALGAEVGEVNVEGVTIAGETVLLAQRGNGDESVNAIAGVALAGVLERVGGGAALGGDLLDEVQRHDLPEVGGVQATFTDLVTAGDGRVLFSACGEATDDPVVDGEFTGALIGVLGGDAAELAPSVKVEGLWCDGGDLLMVADADDRAVPAPLLRAPLPA